MTKAQPKTNNTNKEEQIGFHKGALNTLAKERAEFLRMLNIVEQLIKMHVTSLRELGVDLSKQQEKKKPIEDMLK